MQRNAREEELQRAEGSLEPGNDETARQLAEEREFLGALVGSLEVAVVACDGAGRLRVTNATFRQYGGYGPADMRVGMELPVAGLFWPDGRPVAPAEHPLSRALAGERVAGDELVFDPGGRAPRRVVTTNATVLRGHDGSLLGAVALFYDVTDAKRTALELTDLALHDPLTRCANRLLLSERAERAAEHAERAGLSVGLLLIDLDRFKEVNDSYGHLFGDEVLIDAGRRLRSLVRPGDTVARYGGDEFVVLCQTSGGGSELASIRERIRTHLAAPYRIGNQLVEVGASVGVAALPGGEADLGRLLHAADADMYREKAGRRG